MCQNICVCLKHNSPHLVIVYCDIDSLGASLGRLHFSGGACFHFLFVLMVRLYHKKDALDINGSKLHCSRGDLNRFGLLVNLSQKLIRLGIFNHPERKSAVFTISSNVSPGSH